MSKLPLTLKSTAPVSKVDATPWSRELWRAAYAWPGAWSASAPTAAPATLGTWYLRAARRRFTTPAAGGSLSSRAACARPADPDQRHPRQRRRAAPPGSRTPHPPPAVGQPAGRRALPAR